jgi:hypothetical protein
MNTQIIAYTDRTWQAIDDNGRTIKRFSAGPIGKLDALKTAVNWRNPLALAAAQAIVDRHNRPEVASRTWRGLELAATGAVTAAVYGRNERELCRVKSGSQQGAAYAITVDGGRLACNCHDHINGNAPQVGQSKLCKHIIAVIISMIAGIDPTPQQPADSNTFYSPAEMANMEREAASLWRRLARQTRDAAGVVGGPMEAAVPVTEAERAAAKRIGLVQSTRARMSRNAAFRELDRQAEARRVVEQGNAVLFGE